MEQFDLYQSADFFMVRTALLPYESTTGLDDKQHLFKFYCEQGLFQEAIAIASPTLHQALKELASNFSVSELDKVYLSLLKYFLRMRSRTTPFGLFSSVSWGQFSKKTDLYLDMSQLKKRVRPDMAWVKSLIHSLHQDYELIKQYKVMTNPEIIRRGKKICLTKTTETKKNKNLISINSTTASEAVLSLAKFPITYLILEVKLNAIFPQHDRKKITDCIDQIFQKEYLISEFSICVNKPFKLSEIISKIERKDKKQTDFLNQLNNKLIAYEKCTPGNGLELLEDIYHNLNERKEVEYPVHVDTYQNSSSIQLDDKIKKDLSRAATALWLLSQDSSTKNTYNEYRSDFLEKYGTSRLVPIQELIHEIKGLGDLKQDQKEEKRTTATLIEHLFSKITNGEMIIDNYLEHLWSQLKDRCQDAPLSLELFFDIITDANGKDACIVMNPVMAAEQAGCTFGRFLYLWEEDKTKINSLREFLCKEESLYEQATFVEASFLPENARTSNVCYFEKIRDFQLQLYYHENDPRILDLEDIYVGATTKRLYLYSKKLNREIYVRLSSAINPELAPPILKLILEISQSRFGPFSPYIWNGLPKTLPFLPRVKFSNIVLSPARWFIDFNHLKLDRKSNPKTIEKGLRNSLEKDQISESVYLTHFDHRLLLKSDDPEHIKIMCQHLINKGELTLYENLIQHTPTIHSQKGFHVAEFVVPMVKNNLYPVPKDIYFYPTIEIPSNQNRFSIFQKEWIFTKIALPEDYEEEFLRQQISPFINSLMQNQILDKWFYIRYKEDKSHIRLRLKSQSNDHYLQMVDKLNDWCGTLLSNNLISGVSSHIYERELERYGGTDCIEYAEDVFFLDSQCCLYLLEIFNHPTNRLPLTVFAALGIIHYLVQLNGQLDSMIQFLSPIEQEISHLSGFREHSKIALKYAQELFFPNGNNIDENDFILTHLAKCFSTSTTPVQNYRKEIEKIETKKSIIDSILHMHCNRLMGIDSTLEKKGRVIAYHLLKKVKYQKKQVVITSKD